MKRVLSVLLVAVLCFTICAVPLRTEAKAIAGEVIAGSIGIAAIAIIASSMGAQLSSAADFQAACRACWDGLSSSLKTLVNNSVQYTEGKLIMTALVSAAGFKSLWDTVHDFYFPESGVITVGADTATAIGGVEGVPNTVYVYTPTSTSDHRMRITETQYNTIKNTLIFADYDISFQGQYYNGTRLEQGTVKFSIEGHPDGTNYHIAYSAYFNGTFLAGSGGNSTTQNQTYGIGYFLIGDTLTISPFSLTTGLKGVYYIQPAFWTVTAYNGNKPHYILDSATLQEQREIPVTSSLTAIPPEAVYEGWKEKSTSAGGITFTADDVAVLTEVFGDVGTADPPMTSTQTQTLTQTGVIEGINTLQYPDLENYQAVSGDLRLRDVFPFCIPFDMVDMVTGFRSAREAPHIDWTLEVPGIVEYTFDIDFEQFDDVAQILRTMELICFCVALAFATRHIIRA